ncbi:MAG: phosphate-starvation-inducible PsiE family protein [Gammaproteobacteria bacterium]|nr:phosphate-starvation-inducible PsiE family protein [Gammaproteobacteria bacterium]
MTDKTRKFGRRSLKLIEYGGLIVITIATLVAGIQEILSMVSVGRVTLADLLMLFIFLEVIAMVGVYLDSGKLPVRMPLYIAIVALARYLALDIKHIDSWEIFAVAGAILILSAATLAIRYGNLRLPYPPCDSDQAPQVEKPPAAQDKN